MCVQRCVGAHVCVCVCLQFKWGHWRVCRRQAGLLVPKQSMKTPPPPLFLFLPDHRPVGPPTAALESTPEGIGPPHRRRPDGARQEALSFFIFLSPPKVFCLVRPVLAEPRGPTGARTRRGGNRGLSAMRHRRRRYADSWAGAAPSELSRRPHTFVRTLRF